MRWDENKKISMMVKDGWKCHQDDDWMSSLFSAGDFWYWKDFSDCDNSILCFVWFFLELIEIKLNLLIELKEFW